VVALELPYFLVSLNMLFEMTFGVKGFTAVTSIANVFFTLIR